MTEYVWIGQAWIDGREVEKVVHTRELNCRIDIEQLAAGKDVDGITVEKERVYEGE